MRRQKLIIIVCLAILTQIQGQDPSFTLPNILKGKSISILDEVSLQYNDGNQQYYSYQFFAAMFSGPPSIAYSISSMSIDQTNIALNFFLSVQVQDSQIFFIFNSPTYKWTVTIVTFCITSRSDIVVAKNIYSNFGIYQDNLISGRTTNFNFPIANSLASIDAKSIHSIFIVGLYANYTNDFTLSVNATSLSPTTAFIAINVGAKVSVTNISILSIIYNPNNGQFVSNSGTLNYKSFTSQYFNIFNNFMPIYYLITGLNAISLNGSNLNSFSYKLSLINSSVLASSSSVTFNTFGLSYFSIGVPMKTICGDCNNYVYNGNCLNDCPDQSYPYVFQDGGKACLICDGIVGQILNSLGKGCSCMPGFQLISANQCSPTNKTSLKCIGTNVIQNGTSCICSPGTYNISGTCGTCPSGQIYQNGVCSNPNINCPPQSVYNLSTRSCTCLPGFFDISGFCVQCPTGTVFDGVSCVTASCKDNQVLVNNICICNSQSISVGSICVKCIDGTFSNKGKICDSCIANCIKCLNNVTCSQCKDGFYFDFSSLACIDPNVPVVQKIVSIKKGFPIYTLEGIITDFTINSSSVAFKSKADLLKMISLQFLDLNTIPRRAYYSQNPNDASNIRIAFYYQGLIPLNPFKVTISFVDISLNLQQNTTVSYQYTSDKLQYHPF